MGPRIRRGHRLQSPTVRIEGQTWTVVSAFALTIRGSFQSASVKGIGGSWSPTTTNSLRVLMRQGSSKSSARKAASAMIAKIPLPLSRHIAAVWRETPKEREPSP